LIRGINLCGKQGAPMHISVCRLHLVDFFRAAIPTDIRQAEALVEVLAEKRPHELQLAWWEANKRGKTWGRLIADGVSQLAPRSRDPLLKVVGERRAIVPGIDLIFGNPPAHYDFSRDVVTFVGNALGSPVQCAISREALDDHFDSQGLSNEGRVQKFLENRFAIEHMAFGQSRNLMRS
jgi:hypothetical protein